MLTTNKKDLYRFFVQQTFEIYGYWRRFLCLVVLSVVFAGCASVTPYQGIGNNKEGGYSATQHSDDSYSVTYQGTEYSQPEQVYDYALLRSAELTVECGYAYFVITSGDVRNQNTYRYNPGMPASRDTEYRTSPLGTPYTYTAYSPATAGHSYQIKIPAYTFTIKMYKEKNAVRAPWGQVQEAAPLISQLKAKYKLK